jgi:hypothetical protein
MSIDLVLLARTDDALRQFEDFMGSQPIPTDEATGRFYHVVTALSDAIQMNYVVLRRALDNDDQTMMAWSCRNLLEIAIFTKFALVSAANADEFVADRLIDGKQIGTNLKRLEQILNPSLTASAFDTVIDRFDSQMRAEGITRTRYLSTRDLAGQVGLQDDYDTMNQVCSKFVHPTSWSIFTSDLGSERFPDARDIFYTCGAQYAATAMAEIMPHIRQWGLRHKQ